MVLQCTVWDQMLWILCYEDARWALKQQGVLEIVFADDINGYKVHLGKEEDATM